MSDVSNEDKKPHDEKPNAEFAKTLRDLMLRNRISASDLAREVWGSFKDARGYDVARNRDRIGHYLSGKSMPGSDNLAKIAKALKVSLHILEKTAPAPAVRDMSKSKMLQILLDPDSGLGRFSASDVHLTVESIMAIMDILNKDPVYDGHKKGNTPPHYKNTTNREENHEA